MVVLHEGALLLRHEDGSVATAEVRPVKREDVLLDGHVALRHHELRFDRFDDGRGVGEEERLGGLVVAMDGYRERNALSFGREETDGVVIARENLLRGEMHRAEVDGHVTASESWRTAQVGARDFDHVASSGGALRRQ